MAGLLYALEFITSCLKRWPYAITLQAAGRGYPEWSLYEDMQDDICAIPTVITKEVDGGISDTTWLIILACSVIVMVVLVWLLWDRRTDGDGA